MKAVVLILVGLAAATAFSITSGNVDTAFKFNEFRVKFNKNYQTTAEYDAAFHNFKQTSARLADYEKRGVKGMGITKFADMSPEEFRRTHLMPKGSFNPDRLAKLVQNGPKMPPRAPPKKINWVTKGATTPVKDQESCGSCWAFSVTENFESMWFLSGRDIPTLAPQQLVDCDPQSYGCRGGWTYWAFEYLMSPATGGQEGEVSYPYTATGQGQDTNCKFNASAVIATLTNFTFAVPQCAQSPCHDNDAALQQAVSVAGGKVTAAPFSICVNAAIWSDWTGPQPLTASECPGNLEDIDHCVQLVGYDLTNATMGGYWIARNSWNTNWGQQGFMYLAFDANNVNTCGLGDVVTFANVTPKKNKHEG